LTTDSYQLSSVYLTYKDGKPIIFMHYPFIAKAGQIQYYYTGIDGVSIDQNEAMLFDDHTEAIGFSEVLRIALARYLKSTDKEFADQPVIEEKKEVESSFDFMLSIQGGDGWSAYSLYFAEHADGTKFATPTISLAKHFDTPIEAAQSKEEFLARFKDQEASILPPIRILPFDKNALIPVSPNEAAQHLGIPANPDPKPSRESYFVIRFVDPTRENDTTGEITTSNWVRYYCEADTADFMEAAEVFDDVTSATKIFNRLREASIEDGPLIELAKESIILKLRLLGQIEQEMGMDGVRIRFNENMIIQVLSVMETETGELQWNIIVQDDYRWVYTDHSQDAEDEQEEDED